jgi:hypothetical protein
MAMHHGEELAALACLEHGGRAIVAAIGGGRLTLWDLATGGGLGALALSDDPLTAIAGGAVGGRAGFAVGDLGGRLWLLDADGARPRLGPIAAHAQAITDVVVGRRDGAAVVFARAPLDTAVDGEGEYAYGGVVRCFDAASGAELGERAELEELGCLAGRGDLLLASSAGEVHVLAGAAPAVFARHDRMVGHAAIAALEGGDAVVSADPFGVWLWRPADLGGAVALHPDDPDLGAPIVGLAAAGARLALARCDGTLERWDLGGRAPTLAARLALGGEIVALAATLDGGLVVGRPDGALERVALA